MTRTIFTGILALAFCFSFAGQMKADISDPVENQLLGDWPVNPLGMASADVVGEVFEALKRVDVSKIDWDARKTRVRITKELNDVVMDSWFPSEGKTGLAWAIHHRALQRASYWDKDDFLVFKVNSPELARYASESSKWKYPTKVFGLKFGVPSEDDPKELTESAIEKASVAWFELGDYDDKEADEQLVVACKKALAADYKIDTFEALWKRWKGLTDEDAVGIHMAWEVASRVSPNTDNERVAATALFTKAMQHVDYRWWRYDYVEEKELERSRSYHTNPWTFSHFIKDDFLEKAYVLNCLLYINGYFKKGKLTKMDGLYLSERAAEIRKHHKKQHLKFMKELKIKAHPLWTDEFYREKSFEVSRKAYAELAKEFEDGKKNPLAMMRLEEWPSRIFDSTIENNANLFVKLLMEADFSKIDGSKRKGIRTMKIEEVRVAKAEKRLDESTRSYIEKQIPKGLNVVVDSYKDSEKKSHRGLFKGVFFGEIGDLGGYVETSKDKAEFIWVEVKKVDGSNTQYLLAEIISKAEGNQPAVWDVYWQKMLEASAEDAIGGQMAAEIILALKPESQQEHIAAAMGGLFLTYHSPWFWWKKGSYCERGALVNVDLGGYNETASKFLAHESVSPVCRQALLIHCVHAFVESTTMPKYDGAYLSSEGKNSAETIDKKRPSIFDPQTEFTTKQLRKLEIKTIKSLYRKIYKRLKKKR